MADGSSGTEITRRMERDFQEEFLTCSLCSEAYDQDQRVAKYLPCLHTFCKGCLIQYIQNREECVCPVCRKTSDVPEQGVNGIPNNFTVENLKEYHAIFRAEPGQKHGLQCTSCEDGLDAKSFCHDCGCFLCHDCTGAHRKMRQLKGHALSSITDLQQKMRSPALLRKERCEQHKGQELSLYCIKCGVAVCNTCAIAGHERNEGHLLVDLDDELENAKCELRQKAREVEKQEEPIARLSGHIDSRINNLSATCAKMEKKICENFQELKCKLEERRDIAIGDLRQMCQAKAKNLRVQKDSVESIVTQITSACEFAERACTSANPSQLLGARNQVLERLQELSIMASKPLLTDTDFSLSFHDSHFKAIIDIQKTTSNLGMISSVKQVSPASCQIHLHEEPIIAGNECRAIITTGDSTFQAHTSVSEIFQTEIISHETTGEGTLCRITDNGIGTYIVSFAPVVPGPHTMIVKLRGEEIIGSPLDFEVAEATFNANVTWAKAFPNVTHTVVVDASNNQDGEENAFTTDSLSLSVTVETTGGREIPNRVSTKHGGKYFVKYTPTTAEDLRLSISINGHAVVGSPFVIHVENLSPTSTGVTWDPLPVVNQIWRIHIMTKSEDGESLTTGGHDIIVRVTDQSSAKEIPCTVADNKDGTYTAVLIPRTEATHMIRVILDNVLLGSSLYEEQIAVSRTVGKPKLVKPTCLAINKTNREVCVVDAVTHAIVSPDADWEFTHLRRKLDPVAVPFAKIAFDNNGRFLLMVPRTRCVYIEQSPTTDMWIIPEQVIRPVTINPTPSGEIIIGDSISYALFMLSISGSLVRKIPLSPGCMTENLDNVCVDANGNIYVCHGVDNSIFRIDLQGNSARVLQMVGKHKLWLAITVTPENTLLISQHHGNILVVDVGQERPVFRQEIQAGIGFAFNSLAVDPFGGYVLALDADAKRVIKHGYRGSLPNDITDEEVRGAGTSSSVVRRDRHSSLTLVEDVF